MENENIRVFNENNNAQSENLEQRINQSETSETKEERSNKETKTSVDKNKYIQLAKERLAATYRSALQTYDVSKLEDAKKQIEELDKLETKKDFISYLKTTISEAYRILTNKEKIFTCKSLEELKQQKQEINSAIHQSEHTYTHLNNLLKTLGDNLSTKNNEIVKCRAKVTNLTKKIEEEKSELFGLEEALPQMEGEYKDALIAVKAETELTLSNLEMELYYEQENHELAIDDRNLYMIEKTDLVESIKAFEFNLNFYKKEINELDFLIKKHSAEFYIDSKIQGELASYHTQEIKNTVKERENQKINIYNEAKETQPSLLDMKKQYVESIKNSPKLKRI